MADLTNPAKEITFSGTIGEVNISTNEREVVGADGNKTKVLRDTVRMTVIKPDASMVELVSDPKFVANMASVDVSAADYKQQVLEFLRTYMGKHVTIKALHHIAGKTEYVNAADKVVKHNKDGFNLLKIVLLPKEAQRVAGTILAYSSNGLAIPEDAVRMALSNQFEFAE